MKYIKIPDLGEQTEVGFNAEDASGYRVGVVGVKRSDGANFVLAGGGTDPFDIEPDSTYQVSVDVKPYALSVQRPDTLQAASSVTFEATLRGFSNIFNRHYLNYTVNEEEVGIYGFGQQESGDFQVLDDSTSQSVVQFTLPELAQDTTLYVRHRWATRTDGSWQTNEGEGLATLDFPSATGVFEIPIAGESGSNVIIVFAKDGTHERTTVE